MEDPFVSCPYEKIHRVPRSRLQGHIVKCQKHSPSLQVCPYNATHRLPEDLIKKHISECPSKVQVMPENSTQNPVTAATSTPRPILQKDYLPKTDPNYEIWDD